MSYGCFLVGTKKLAVKCNLPRYPCAGISSQAISFPVVFVARLKTLWHLLGLHVGIYSVTVEYWMPTMLVIF